MFQSTAQGSTFCFAAILTRYTRFFLHVQFHNFPPDKMSETPEEIDQQVLDWEQFLVDNVSLRFPALFSLS